MKLRDTWAHMACEWTFGAGLMGPASRGVGQVSQSSLGQQDQDLSSSSSCVPTATNASCEPPPPGWRPLLRSQGAGLKDCMAPTAHLVSPVFPGLWGTVSAPSYGPGPVGRDTMGQALPAVGCWPALGRSVMCPPLPRDRQAVSWLKTLWEPRTRALYLADFLVLLRLTPFPCRAEPYFLAQVNPVIYLLSLLGALLEVLRPCGCAGGRFASVGSSHLEMGC